MLIVAVAEGDMDVVGFRFWDLCCRCASTKEFGRAILVAVANWEGI